MRQLFAGLAAAAVASIGAVVLGEYDLHGVVALISGLLFGLAVTEVAIGVGRRLARPTAGATAVICGLGFTWAVWIATNHFRDPVPLTAWIGVAVSVGGSLAWSVGAIRTGGGHRSRVPAGTPPKSDESPDGRS